MSMTDGLMAAGAVDALATGNDSMLDTAIEAKEWQSMSPKTRRLTIIVFASIFGLIFLAVIMLAIFGKAGESTTRYESTKAGSTDSSDEENAKQETGDDPIPGDGLRIGRGTQQ
jgi:hypothetical protein